MELPDKFPYNSQQIDNADKIAVERLDLGQLVPVDAFDCLSITNSYIQSGEVKVSTEEDAIIINGLNRVFKR